MLAIFSDVSDKTLDRLLREVFMLVNVPKGKVLYEEGEEAKDFYFVYTGRIVLTGKSLYTLFFSLHSSRSLGNLTCFLE